MEDQEEEAEKQISQKKERAKRPSIRSRNSRKITQKSGKLYYEYKKLIG
ncbi:MAG: hypothetical protein ACMUEL_06805 [Flavobacteriales bacterium Tduv]